MTDDGDGEIRICQNCGEAVYPFDEEEFQICPRCAACVSNFEGGD